MSKKRTVSFSNKVTATEEQAQDLIQEPVIKEQKAEEVLQEPVVEVTEPAAVAAAEEPPSAEAEEQAPKAEEKEVKDQSAWEKKIEKIKTEGSVGERTLVNGLENYVTKMAPGRVMSMQEIATQQLTLWRCIKLAVENEEEFSSMYKLLIDYAKEYKDAAFNERYLFRGMENVTLDKDQIHAFLGSLNVIKLASISKSKKEAAAQVDLNRVMDERVFSEGARNRVISFFK